MLESTSTSTFRKSGAKLVRKSTLGKSGTKPVIKSTLGKSGEKLVRSFNTQNKGRYYHRDWQCNCIDP
jgi:hypothetical protein